MSEDHTHDTKHVEGEYSDDGYDKTLLAYASNEDQDLDKEEDEEEEEETEEEVKMRKEILEDVDLHRFAFDEQDIFFIQDD